jgi:preprotein translocase subunit SecE
MGLLSVYKGDQGRGVRIFAIIGTLVLALWACVNLYDLISPPIVPPAEVWYDVDFLGIQFPLSWYLIPPAALFVLIAVVLWSIAQKPKVAEFLIETEGELKKVSWPARKEWINSSMAVMVVILIFIAYLFAVDTGLSFLFTQLKIGF